MTAKIVVITRASKTHKLDHGCFKDNPFLKGLYQFSKFCPRCGENVEEDGSLTFSVCSSCGQGVAPLEEIKYCSNCGDKFEGREYRG